MTDPSPDAPPETPHDPLAEVVALLQPRMGYTKLVQAAGRWRAGRRAAADALPFYALILDGACRLTVDGMPPLTLGRGDFVLIPTNRGHVAASLDAPPEDAPLDQPVLLSPGMFRVGDPDGAPGTRLLIGQCVFGGGDPALLVSFLPRFVLVRGAERLGVLVRLLDEEARAARPARDIVLARLLEVVLIEAIRSTDGVSASPGLVRGLADDRLAVALRHMHAQPARAWTVGALARLAGLSRSVFFERFRDAVGLAPMAYLHEWRMALAMDLLHRRSGDVAGVAARVGYSSASTFSAAFTRHAGLPPARFARMRDLRATVPHPAA